MDNMINRYLEDAIAAEKSFETQLTGFAGEATHPEVQSAFATHARETKLQYESLTSRLKALGSEPSTLKSAMAHIFNMAPKAAQLGHEEVEKTTQDLIMAFAVENAEVAMYESMTVAAEHVGDAETASLAKRIQAEEKQTAEKVFKFIAPCASQAYMDISASDPSKGEEAILRYLQDAEAAERNFEDALASFSKAGDQPAVQSLLQTMSAKAKTQHERLERRLEQLGGTRSTMKSLLAHMLAFTPVSAQLGHSSGEKSTQHLMITYAAAAAEIGMYESLAASAQAAGDSETAQLARQLQSEEKEDHALAWEHLSRSARASVAEVANGAGR